jgi:hypothetical protein
MTPDRFEQANYIIQNQFAKRRGTIDFYSGKALKFRQDGAVAHDVYPGRPAGPSMTSGKHGSREKKISHLCVSSPK